MSKARGICIAHLFYPQLKTQRIYPLSLTYWEIRLAGFVAFGLTSAAMGTQLIGLKAYCTRYGLFAVNAGNLLGRS